jgi:hypothetical protein
MTIVLTVLGAVMILAGLVVLFGRTRDAAGETKFKFKDIEIASAKPSIMLACLGTVLVVLPHVTGGKDTPEPNIPGLYGPLGPTGPSTQDYGSRCCIDAVNACPMALPAAVGASCLCMDVMGNMANGSVCK